MEYVTFVFMGCAGNTAGCRFTVTVREGECHVFAIGEGVKLECKVRLGVTFLFTDGAWNMSECSLIVTVTEGECHVCICSRGRCMSCRLG